MEQMNKTATRVKALREAMGLTAEQTAEKTGFSLSDYNAYESGEKEPTFSFVYKCAEVFGVELKDIAEGTSPTLTVYNLTRKGEGVPIERHTGFTYSCLAPSFKNKTAEPFKVIIPADAEKKYSSHEGQELNIVIRGTLSITIGERTEELHEGDSIYYNSGNPHALTALNGESCEIFAIVMKGSAESSKPVIVETRAAEYSVNSDYKSVADSFVNCETDENGVLKSVKFNNADKFNFAYDCVDKIAEKTPEKLAMLWVSNDKKEKRFTFGDMKKYSNMTANYFASLGIKRGDKVMVVLKRHYQFWFTMLALHKMGAVAIPATCQLVEHDFTYRFKAAGVTAIVCTGDGDVANQAEIASAEFPNLVKILVGGKHDKWNDFNAEMTLCDDKYERQSDSPCGDEPMLMLFTSGTSGYPRIAAHSYKYALGHYVTARYWHNVYPDGIHFTISDTGWGKALWGKLYGQWLCEAAIFTYDFDRFNSNDILPMFKQYNITSFCAPPTMYRFFIKEDLSKFDLSSIKYATTAGEALNPEVFNRFKEATGLTIMEGFGQTETTLTVANLVGTTPRIGSMGRPSPLYDVVLLDHDGNISKDGEPGEICIRTSDEKPCGLFLGYYNDEEKTKEVWHDGFYHTGDQATRDEDGYLWYVGRIDDVIKSSGYRIGPFEIESVIMELPYVLECAITGVPDAVRGQIVKATIVLTKGTAPSDELKKEVQDYVKTHTAPYKYPRMVEFVEELPKTISGKVRRVELREKDSKAQK